MRSPEPRVSKIASRPPTTVLVARGVRDGELGRARGLVVDCAQLRPGRRADLRTERSALTLEQAQALLEHGPGEITETTTARQEHNIVRDRAMFTLMIFLGPRVAGGS